MLLVLIVFSVFKFNEFGVWIWSCAFPKPRIWQETYWENLILTDVGIGCAFHVSFLRRLGPILNRLEVLWFVMAVCGGPKTSED